LVSAMSTAALYLKSGEMINILKGEFFHG